MFLGPLFTILIVIISLLCVTPGVTYRRTHRQQLKFEFCYKNYTTWSCSNNEKCGNTSNSCIHIPNSNELSSAGSTVEVTIGLFIWLILCFGIPCYRYYQRKQAEKKFIRRVQTAVAQNIQPRAVYIIVDPSVADTSLIHEQPPPTYEQSTGIRQS